MLTQQMLFGPKRKRKYQYRYRMTPCSTSQARRKFDRIIAKIGQVVEVRGYRYLGSGTRFYEAVMLKGVKGTARLSGLCWGYGGEGPRGLVELLLKLGLPKEQAEDVAFNSKRGEHADEGTDWKIVLGWSKGECPPHKNRLFGAKTG